MAEIVKITPPEEGKEPSKPLESAKPIPGEVLAKRKEFEQLGRKQQAEIVKNLIRQVDEESNVPRDKVAAALKDENKADRFETLARTIGTMASLIGNVADIMSRLFGEVGDNNEEDYKPEQIAAVKKEISERKFDTPNREKIVNIAQSMLGSPNFRGEEVDGGNLACAQVVSRILRLSGCINKELLGVTATRAELRKQNWTEHQGPPRPGDVVIWNRTQKTENDGNVKLGYPHIGIVVGSNTAISNSSGARMPRMHNMGYKKDNGYWNRRGIDTFMSPPEQQAVS
ncbi:hypothetical protein KBD59_02940 [Candidatus Gracilibacteria bacterium]|nr:hypothetical protein [Candidatus Gracilibacteria bacterium]